MSTKLYFITRKQDQQKYRFASNNIRRAAKILFHVKFKNSLQIHGNDKKLSKVMARRGVCV